MSDDLMTGKITIGGYDNNSGLWLDEENDCSYIEVAGMLHVTLRCNYHDLIGKQDY